MFAFGTNRVERKMKASDLVRTVELMTDCGLVDGAKTVLNQNSSAVGPNAWAYLRKIVVEATKRSGGVPKGYKFRRVPCPKCGKVLAVNKLTRHRCL